MVIFYEGSVLPVLVSIYVSMVRQQIFVELQQPVPNIETLFISCCYITIYCFVLCFRFSVTHRGNIVRGVKDRRIWKRCLVSCGWTMYDLYIRTAFIKARVHDTTT